MAADFWKEGQKQRARQNDTIYTKQNADLFYQQTPRHPQEALRSPHHPAEYVLPPPPTHLLLHKSLTQQKTEDLKVLGQ